MAGEKISRHRWVSHFMMVVSLLAACVLVPLGFILSGSFAAWLKTTGVHASPNFDDGAPVAEFGGFMAPSPADAGSLGKEEPEPALSIQKFAVKKVAFRRFSGIGIEPRLNLCFEFDRVLGNPKGDGGELGSTVIHVYLKAPGRAGEIPGSNRAARVEFEESGWDFEIIVDGYHEQARIFDIRGNPLGQGLGLYVRHEESSAEELGMSAGSRSGRTKVTAGLPMKLLGDPAIGEWRAYVLVGLADSRHPSMMLHSGPDGSLTTFRAVLADNHPIAPGIKPRLHAFVIRNPS
jgi:hypothetical protein